MGADETEICGSKGREVQKRAARGSLQEEPERTSFTPDRQIKFLDHFAATCNARAACRASGVGRTTVYAWRRDDPQFRAAWNEALSRGYADVEAELVRESIRSLQPRPDPEAPPLIDPRTALAVLESYRRNGDRRPGDILPQRSDIEQVRARLETKMRALGLLPADGGGEEDGDRGGAEDGA
ncbi:MAG: hypothetical protein QOF34_868 [Sphingomonadales bacterium]|nr:hypothetical protein [Sphingomonadales bacterium]